MWVVVDAIVFQFSDTVQCDRKYIRPVNMMCLLAVSSALEWYVALSGLEGTPHRRTLSSSSSSLFSGDFTAVVCCWCRRWSAASDEDARLGLGELQCANLEAAASPRGGPALPIGVT